MPVETLDLRDSLHQNFVKLISTSRGTNNAQSWFFRQMEGFRTSEGFRRQRRADEDWADAVYPESEAVRLAIYDLASIGEGAPRLLTPTTAFPLYGSRKLMRVISTPVVTYDQALRSSVEDYITRFVSNEIRTQVAIALQGASSEPGYQAIISFDYYASRGLASSRAHKDTFGNTLFVMLHYDNRSTMEGPEYVIDKWPAPVTGNGLMPGPLFSVRHALGETRGRAPWKLTPNGIPFWPRTLLRALEHARDLVARDHEEHTWYKSLIGARGMIIFVDELIYHMTPLMFRRQDDGAGQTKYAQAALSDDSNTLINVVPNNTQRTVRKLSMDLAKWEQEDARTGPARLFPKSTRYDGTGGMSTRRFNRVWISIVPDDWYRDVV